MKKAKAILDFPELRQTYEFEKNNSYGMKAFK